MSETSEDSCYNAESAFTDLWGRLKFCISDRFSGDAAVLALRPHFEEQLLEHLNYQLLYSRYYFSSMLFTCEPA